MENVYKVKLGTGKVVHLREMKVRYEDLALKAVGTRAGKNDALMQKMMGDELLKILIVDIDGKRPTGQELERLDDTFSYMEIISLRKIVAKVAGLDQLEGEKEPELELIASNSGAQ